MIEKGFDEQKKEAYWYEDGRKKWYRAWVGIKWRK